MQCGCARCCIILQPDFLSLQGRLRERDLSSTGIDVNARFDAVRDESRYQEFGFFEAKPEWAEFGRLSRHFVTYRIVVPMTLTAGASWRSETASPKYPRPRRFETSKILCLAAQGAIAFRNRKPVKTTVLTKRTPRLWRKADAARTPSPSLEESFAPEGIHIRSAAGNSP